MEGFEQDPQTKKVRCIVCKEADVLGLGIWIQKGSLYKHLESDAHKIQVMRKLQRDQWAASEQSRLHAAYSGPAASSNNDFSDLIHSPHIGLFDSADADGDVSLPGPSHCWTEPMIPAFIAPIVHNHSTEREWLQQQFEEMLLQAEHEDEFSLNDSDALDDITATNISAEFSSLGAQVSSQANLNLIAGLSDNRN
jgi:hypothetical protein